jgi:hypothetical protein
MMGMALALVDEGNGAWTGVPLSKEYSPSISLLEYRWFNGVPYFGKKESQSAGREGK